MSLAKLIEISGLDIEAVSRILARESNIPLRKVASVYGMKEQGKSLKEISHSLKVKKSKLKTLFNSKKEAKEKTKSLVLRMLYAGFQKHEIKQVAATDGELLDRLFNGDELSASDSDTSVTKRQKTSEDENGSVSTRGKLNYSNGDAYKGMMRNLKPHGRGVMVYGGNKNETYDGDWVNGERAGTGKYTSADGDTYDGKWKNDKKNGQGKYEWAETEVTYEGNWKNDKRHGKGEMIWPDGDNFEGEWVNDKKHGFGRYEYAESEEGRGYTFYGTYKNDERHGLGVAIYPDEGNHIGNWVEGKREGMFVFTRKGYSSTRLWKNGEKVEISSS